jgi:excisionase family DNA binding protein
MATAQQVTEEDVAIPRMLRVGEAAEVLHVHPNTLRKWSGRGLIPSYRIGSRQDRRFLLDDLMDYLRSNRVVSF